jgi:hypothetical protein
VKGNVLLRLVLFNSSIASTAFVRSQSLVVANQANSLLLLPMFNEGQCPFISMLRRPSIVVAD